MPAPLTPTQIIADLRALDRIERDWSAEGHLDSDAEKDIAELRYEMMAELRERFTTRVDHGSVFKEIWAAWEGEIDYDHNGHTFVPTIPVAYGKTELEAIETLLEMIGEDA